MRSQRWPEALDKKYNSSQFKYNSLSIEKNLEISIIFALKSTLSKSCIFKLNKEKLLKS